MLNLKTIICFTLSFAFSVQLTNAQLAKKYRSYEEKRFRSMRYGLYKPENYDNRKSYPLIVYLHGSTDTVSRDLVWYQESIQKDHPCFVLSPKCEVADQGWGNTWNEQHSEATAKTLALVDSLIKRHNINTNRLYLYGISMGGFGVFSVLQKDSGKFAAAYAVCGGSNAKAADKIKGSPLWIFHGESDDVVPVNLSRDIYYEIVRQGGRQARYTEYAGVKHNSWENVSREKTLSKWLFLQEKGKTVGVPDRVAELTAETQSKSIVLTWAKPSNAIIPAKDVWYYKVFRDGNLLTEIDNERTTYTDEKPGKGDHTYWVTAVNYFSGESAHAEIVKAVSLK